VDKRVTARKDGTLYLSDCAAPLIVQRRAHSVLYYIALFTLVLFMLGSLAITVLFVFFSCCCFYEQEKRKDSK
jgi:predicted membrane protein